MVFSMQYSPLIINPSGFLHNVFDMLNTCALICVRVCIYIYICDCHVTSASCSLSAGHQPHSHQGMHMQSPTMSAGYVPCSTCTSAAWGLLAALLVSVKVILNVVFKYCSCLHTAAQLDMTNLCITHFTISYTI